MSKSWDEHADGWDTDPAVVTYAERAFETLGRHVRIEGARVLDFGCGTGLLTARVARTAASVVGLDPSPKMIEALDAKGLAGVSTIASPLTPSLAREDERLREPFDVITASSVCAFVPDYRGTLAALSALLAPAGTLLQWDWARGDDDGDFGFTEAEIEAGLTHAGLEVIQVGRAFTMSSDAGEFAVLLGVGRKRA